MNYSLSIDIGLPVNRVIELFDNAENMPKWQPELISFEHLSGEQGEVGAKSQLKYKMGKREIDMIETIVSKNLPEDFTGTYEAKGVWNKVHNKFVEVSPNKTRWEFETEFKCEGFVMKIMAFLMPGSFKKQSFLFMERFKEFAEQEETT